MTMKTKTLSILLVLLVLPSCWLAREQVNEPIDALAVAQLQPGTSTARQVVDLLGGPVEVVQLGRRTAYLYSASTQKSANLWAMALALSNTDTRQDRVWVFFDEADVLTHVGATFESHRAQYAMPWEDVHEPADSQQRDQNRPGVGQ